MRDAGLTQIGPYRLDLTTAIVREPESRAYLLAVAPLEDPHA